MKFTAIVAVLASTLLVSAAALPIEVQNTVALAQEVPTEAALQSGINETSVKSYIIVLKDTVVAQDIMTAERAIVKAGGTIEHRFTDVLKGFSAWLPNRAYKALLANPLVQYIEEDGESKITV
ncbi:MAG: hypothetical protein J3Q66DRAFT_342880 [Benniella sp.]|nr:MAG: hypothetical protein J3Q66DRAFT_342880 [Benniella sp.]